MSTRKKNTYNMNHSARIVTREDRFGKLRTETKGRDDYSLNMAITTDQKVNRTKLFIDDVDGTSHQFDGRQARSLYRLLQRHYRETGKSLVA